ncbi:MAG: DegV family protein, partial [Dehalococcoidia bacterium]|nr:DegV family protein [Dehalococcoidia bacterium]
MAETKRRIEIINSGSVSVSLSLVAIAAAKGAKAGKSLHQVLHRVKEVHSLLAWAWDAGLSGYFDYGAEGGGELVTAPSLVDVEPLRTILQMECQ